MKDQEAAIEQAEQPQPGTSDDAQGYLTKDEALMCGILKDRFIPLSDHHYRALMERLGEPDREELLEMVRTGIRKR